MVSQSLCFKYIHAKYNAYNARGRNGCWTYTVSQTISYESEFNISRINVQVVCIIYIIRPLEPGYWKKVATYHDQYMLH